MPSVAHDPGGVPPRRSSCGSPTLAPGAPRSLPTLLSAAGGAQGWAGLRAALTGPRSWGLPHPGPSALWGRAGQLGLGEWSRLCACPHSSSPGPALPLLDPVTWLISQSPPTNPSFHQRSWASSPSAGEGSPPPSRPRWVLANALCDVGEAFRSGSSISCWLLLACVVAGGSGPWRPPPSGEHRREGPWGALRDGALLGRGLPPARGRGAAVAGPRRPHPGAPGAWLSLRGPRKQTSQQRLGLLLNSGRRGELCRKQPRG